jgi:hypothetical protein
MSVDASPGLGFGTTNQPVRLVKASAFTWLVENELAVLAGLSLTGLVLAVWYMIAMAKSSAASQAGVHL